MISSAFLRVNRADPGNDDILFRCDCVRVDETIDKALFGRFIAHVDEYIHGPFRCRFLFLALCFPLLAISVSNVSRIGLKYSSQMFNPEADRVENSFSLDRRIQMNDDVGRK